MDINHFANFLVKNLTQLLAPLEDNLLNGRITDISKVQRLVGSREVLKEIIDKMDDLVREFYKASEKASAGDMQVGG